MVPQCITILANVAQLPTVIALSNLPCRPLGYYTSFGEMSRHLIVKANLELSSHKFGIHCRVLFILIKFEFLVFLVVILTSFCSSWRVLGSCLGSPIVLAEVA